MTGGLISLSSLRSLVFPFLPRALLSRAVGAWVLANHIAALVEELLFLVLIERLHLRDHVLAHAPVAQIFFLVGTQFEDLASRAHPRKHFAVGQPGLFHRDNFVKGDESVVVDVSRGRTASRRGCVRVLLGILLSLRCALSVLA